jgi:hypothetical protein
MAKKGIVRTMIAMLLSIMCAVGVFAQITISGGAAMSVLGSLKTPGYGDFDTHATVDLGGNVYLDYFLPIDIPLSLGIETGVDISGISIRLDTTFSETIMVIPILIRAAYHFDLFSKLDLYLLGKIGYVFGEWKGGFKDYLEKQEKITFGAVPSGMAFAFDLGAAYYFTSVFGIFVEGGFDHYGLTIKGKKEGSSDVLEFETQLKRFLTAGLSIKF